MGSNLSKQTVEEKYGLNPLDEWLDHECYPKSNCGNSFKLSDGRDIGYQFHGALSNYKATILLFPGTPSSRLFFFEDHIPTALKYQLRFLTVDYCGIGKSDFDKDFTFTSFANDVFQLLSHLNIQKYHVLGYSAGGPFACVYTALYNKTKQLCITKDNVKGNIDVDSKEKNEEIKQQKENVVEEKNTFEMKNDESKEKDNGDGMRAGIRQRQHEILSAIIVSGVGPCETPGVYGQMTLISKIGWYLVTSRENVAEYAIKMDESSTQSNPIKSLWDGFRAKGKYDSEMLKNFPNILKTFVISTYEQYPLNSIKRAKNQSKNKKKKKNDNNKNDDIDNKEEKADKEKEKENENGKEEKKEKEYLSDEMIEEICKNSEASNVRITLLFGKSWNINFQDIICPITFYSGTVDTSCVPSMAKYMYSQISGSQAPPGFEESNLTQFYGGVSSEQKGAQGMINDDKNESNKDDNDNKNSNDEKEDNVKYKSVDISQENEDNENVYESKIEVVESLPQDVKLLFDNEWDKNESSSQKNGSDHTNKQCNLIWGVDKGHLWYFENQLFENVAQRILYHSQTVLNQNKSANTKVNTNTNVDVSSDNSKSQTAAKNETEVFAD